MNFYVFICTHSIIQCAIINDIFVTSLRVKGLVIINSDVVLHILSELMQGYDHKNPVHSNENRRKLSKHDVLEHDVGPSDKSFKNK